MLKGLDAEAITIWFQKAYKTTLVVEKTKESERIKKNNQRKAYTLPVSAYDHPVAVVRMKEIYKDLVVFQQEFANAITIADKRLRKRKRWEETNAARLNSS